MILSDTMIMVLFSIVMFLSIFGFTFFLIRHVQARSHQRDIVLRIQNNGYTRKTNDEESPDTPEEGKSLLNSFVRLLDHIGNKVMSGKNRDAHTGRHIKFLRAGIKRKNAFTIFWGTKCLMAGLLPALYLSFRYMFLIQMSNSSNALILFILFALAGYYLPDLWLYNKTLHRKENLIKALPDSLDLLVICVEAGMGMDNAFNRVAREMKMNYPDLSDEFSMMNLEMRAGNSRKEALKNISRRTDLTEIDSLMGMLIQTDTFGTSVSNALKIFSESLKEKRFQKAEELAAKTPVKMMMPLICFIFPALLVVLLGPAMIKIYENFVTKM